MELKELLSWVVSGGGAALVAYFLIEKLPVLAALNPEPKRYVAFVLSAALAIGAWFGMAGMLYEPWPMTTYAWIEKLVFIGTSAFTLSQIIHAKRKLAAKK